MSLRHLCHLFVAVPVFALSLAACTTAPAAPPAAAGCNADATQTYVRQVATADVVEAARKAAGADLVRTLKPGQVVTMEYREGRLNLHVDAGNVITRATCG